MSILNKIPVKVSLPAFIIIWSIVGYMLYIRFFPEEQEAQEARFEVSFNNQTPTVKDTFSIRTVERDPFLSTSTKKVKPKKAVTSQKKQSKAIPDVMITYHGLVKRKNSSQKVFVITINGKQHLLKQGQTIEDVSLLSGNEKQIRIRANNTLKTITLETS